MRHFPPHPGWVSGTGALTPAEALRARLMAEHGPKAGAAGAAGAKPAGGQRARRGDWKSLGLGSSRERFQRRELLWTPPALPRRAATAAESLGMLFGALGVNAGGSARLYGTPDGPVVIDPNVAAHIVDKFHDHRELFASRILSTLDADEIWRAEQKPGKFRRRFIKFWSDGRATLAIVDDKENLLYTFMVRRNIDSQRQGELRYRRPEKAKRE